MNHLGQSVTLMQGAESTKEPAFEVSMPELLNVRFLIPHDCSCEYGKYV